MKKLITLVLISGVAFLSYQAGKIQGKSLLPNHSLYSKNHNQSVDLVVPAVTHNGEKYLDAAIQIENGQDQLLDSLVYDLGNQINDQVEQSLSLSAEAKEQTGLLLKEHYPEIADNIRAEYLRQIKELPKQQVNNVVSSSHTTRAEVLAAAINSQICGFASLIFIPMGISLGLGTNIAASHMMYDPCQNLLLGVSNKIGEQIYKAAIARDIEVTESQLKLHKESTLAEFSVASVELSVIEKFSLPREIKVKQWKLAKWEAASLQIEYNASLKYGYDLTTFDIVRDEPSKRIIVKLPEPQLLNLNLEPLLTNIDDSGMPDLGDSHFKSLYEQAKANAIREAEKRGIKQKAKENAQKLFAVIFQPFTQNSHHPYSLSFEFINI